ncbi:hypothetical protein JTE90_029363 [Oedothorax gibbosus]|uniref:Uncharacterized protein n=1 Tax=Oedothorax gibbosus TaxID=931172 RepID=A0AAV6VNY2_9ARAC|nr:hypothetical protein JTE90_029363 [Oedothorax gibbosus]
MSNLLLNSCNGDPLQKAHECDDETSFEVTPEFGYEELEEVSSSITKSSEEENPSGFQSSMVNQETQSDNQTEVFGRVYRNNIYHGTYNILNRLRHHTSDEHIIRPSGEANEKFHQRDPYRQRGQKRLEDTYNGPL